MDLQYYTEYAKLETSHWWFRARINILSSLVNNLIKNKSNQTLSILNVGVATGETTRMLEKFGEVTSLEYNKECCEYLKKVKNIDVVNGSFTDLPFENNSFDIVCAFDVVEHIEDDQLAIQEAYRVLKAKGTCILTVPAYQFLWSEHDEINFHFRRYNRRQFKSLVSKHLKVDYLSYFNFILFPPIAIIRIIGNLIGFRKSKSKELNSDFSFYQQASITNKLFYFLFNLEKFVIGKIIMPFGVSILAVLRKI